MNSLSEEEQLKASIKELDELVDELTSVLDLKKETIVEMQNAYETLNAHDEMLIATVDKLKEENKKLVEALTKIAGRCSIAEDNKDKIHGPEAGVIFAAASAWRMELAKQVLKEIGEE